MFPPMIATMTTIAALLTADQACYQLSLRSEGRSGSAVPASQPCSRDLSLGVNGPDGAGGGGDAAMVCPDAPATQCRARDILPLQHLAQVSSRMSWMLDRRETVYANVSASESRFSAQANSVS